MQPNDKIKLFLVDDDALFLKMLEIEFLDTADFVIETYASGELCIENLDKNPDLIILDYHLDGIDANAMNGLETLDKIKEFDTTIPVVMLSAQDKIDVAIKCMHHKATDYVVKSETAFFRLKQIVSAVLHAQKVEKQLNWYMDRM
ncbi:response regulator [Flavobacterium sp.]|uniref:response regulator n=1 Tax=Flavobacterium sp. TaxID=239 RepID=UPI000ECD38C2|nr:response regulator [Flavobacterium sp.]HCQ13724.1 response regulator [Flavobacterium sp.]